MKKRMMILPLLVMLAMIIAKPVMAQTNQKIEVALQVSQGMEFTVGDPIPLTLAVSHPIGYQVIKPQLDEQWGDFVVLSQSPGTTVDNGDGTETTSRVIDVGVFAPGTFNTPPLLVKVSDGAGGLQEFTTAPTSVTINSVLVEGDNQLRDIKPQADLSYQNIWPWIITTTLAALSLAGILYLRRRRQVQLATTQLDNRLPHEVALEQLRSIEGLRLPESGHFKEHYTLVSECIRAYMERSYQIPILERTTTEIQTSMKIAEIHPEVRREFIDLLTESDLVKFTKFTPDNIDATQVLKSARHIISVTKPMLKEADTSGEDDPGTKKPPGNGYFNMPQNINEETKVIP